MVICFHRFLSVASSGISRDSLRSSDKTSRHVFRGRPRGLRPSTLMPPILPIHSSLRWTWPNHLRRFRLRTAPRSSMFNLRRRSCVLMLLVGFMAHIQRSIALSFLSSRARSFCLRGQHSDAYSKAPLTQVLYTLPRVCKDKLFEQSRGRSSLNFPQAALTLVTVVASQPPLAAMVSPR